jgi:hypothetical protein
MFGRKRALEESEKPINLASTSVLEDARETRPYKERKLMKIGDKFIKWSLSRKGQSPDLPTSRKVLPDKMKTSDNTKESCVVAPTGTTFISWSPTAMAGSSDLPSGQHRHRYPSEPAIATQSSSNHYPDPDWDSPSVTAVDDEEGAPNRKEWLGLPSQDDDRSDGVLTEDSMDDVLELEDVRWATDPTSVSTSITDMAPDVFEDLLDPALFGSESPHSHSSFTPSS